MEVGGDSREVGQGSHSAAAIDILGVVVPNTTASRKSLHKVFEGGCFRLSSRFKNSKQCGMKPMSGIYCGIRR